MRKYRAGRKGGLNMKEKDPLKQFEKSDQELIHDIIDMQFLDANEPIYINWSYYRM